MIKLFVYGTLKSGGRLSQGVEKYRRGCIGAYTPGRLYHNGFFPMLPRNSAIKPSDFVWGEVHEYPNELLQTLDMIEGYDPRHPKHNGFIREGILVYPIGSKKEALVQAYIWNGSSSDCIFRIKDGTWTDDMSKTFRRKDND